MSLLSLCSPNFHNSSTKMSRLARYRSWALHFHLPHTQTLSLLSSFSTSAPESTPVHPSPPPIRVELTEYAGRGVFASRRIGAGELIHTAKPVVAHPSLALVHSLCYFCLRKLRNCDSSSGGSNAVSFCSIQCEEQSKVTNLL